MVFWRPRTPLSNDWIHFCDENSIKLLLLSQGIRHSEYKLLFYRVFPLIVCISLNIRKNTYLPTKIPVKCVLLLIIPKSKRKLISDSTFKGKHLLGNHPICKTSFSYSVYWFGLTVQLFHDSNILFVRDCNLCDFPFFCLTRVRNLNHCERFFIFKIWRQWCEIFKQWIHEYIDHW